MSKILITGCSSGFGLETARLFLERGWEVVATMRTPNTELLPKSDRLRVLPLDVTDAASVSQAVADAGEIDVLVNNAGFGVPAPVEWIEPQTARALLRPTRWVPSPWCRRCFRCFESVAQGSSSMSPRP